MVFGQQVHDAECAKKFFFNVYLASSPSINPSASFYLSHFSILECEFDVSTSKFQQGHSVHPTRRCVRKFSYGLNTTFDWSMFIYLWKKAENQNFSWNLNCLHSLKKRIYLVSENHRHEFQRLFVIVRTPCPSFGKIFLSVWHNFMCYSHVNHPITLLIKNFCFVWERTRSFESWRVVDNDNFFVMA